jgi:hypothetical protein
MNGPLAASPWRLWLAFLGLAAAMGAVAAGFYPVCALHETTGLLCPGCGTLRALHQLTHGNVAAAWRLNALLVALLPAGIWLGARELIWLGTGKRLPGVVTRPIFGWVLVAGFIVFGIARNLPIFR